MNPSAQFRVISEVIMKDLKKACKVCVIHKTLSKEFLINSYLIKAKE